MVFEFSSDSRAASSAGSIPVEFEDDFVFGTSCWISPELLSSFGSGLLLLTLSPMTWPKALTPRSVRPHFEYSQPSQLTSSFSENDDPVGNINLVFISAFHSTSSIVGNGVVLLAWCSKPLNFWPRYANLRAISRVECFVGSNAFLSACFFEVDVVLGGSVAVVVVPQYLCAN